MQAIRSEKFPLDSPGRTLRGHYEDTRRGHCEDITRTFFLRFFLLCLFLGSVFALSPRFSSQSHTYKECETETRHETDPGRRGKRGSLIRPFSPSACISVRTPGRSAECRVENAAQSVSPPKPLTHLSNLGIVPAVEAGGVERWRWCLRIGTGRWRCLQDTAARVRMDYIGHSPRQVLFIDRGHGRRTVPDLDLVRRPPSYGRTALMNGILGTDPTLSELVDSKPPDPG